jgi:hypothetical protein
VLAKKEVRSSALAPFVFIAFDFVSDVSVVSKRVAYICVPYYELLMTCYLLRAVY